MWPFLGDRLIVTPAFAKRWQVWWMSSTRNAVTEISVTIAVGLIPIVGQFKHRRKPVTVPCRPRLSGFPRRHRTLHRRHHASRSVARGARCARQRSRPSAATAPTISTVGIATASSAIRLANPASVLIQTRWSGKGTSGHQGGRRGRVAPGAHQFAANDLQAAEAQYRTPRFRPRDTSPAKARAPNRLGGARSKSAPRWHARDGSSRNSGAARACGRRGDPRHQPKRHAASGQSVHLLAAPREDQRVAPLKRRSTRWPRLGVLHQQAVDLLLRHARCAGTLADIDPRRLFGARNPASPDSANGRTARHRRAASNARPPRSAVPGSPGPAPTK